MRHFPQGGFIYEICWLFLSQPGKNIFRTMTKSSRMAGNADVSRDKNVSLHSITSFKTKGKMTLKAIWRTNCKAYGTQ